MMRKVCNMLKTGVAVLFAFAIIASGICFMGADVNEAYAAASSVKDSTGYNKEDGYFVKEYEEISTYKTTDTYPILDGAEYADAQDWLFAGWYTTDTCETSIGTTQEGEAWAKFIHIDVLSVKCQIEKGTDVGTSKTNMRLISTLDSLKYDTAGFKVRYNGGAELDFPVSKVFKRINASEINGNECGYSPAAFHETSEYFMTYSLLNVANKNFSKPFYIEPYWITLDGTEVSGAGRFARVEDRYLEIVNVPVRLHQDAEATEGSVTVNYNIIDSDETVIYEPYKVDDTIQYDNGTVFDVVTVVADNDAKTVMVTATEEAEGVQAKGMLVNLRFQMIADAMPSTSTFEISSSDFNVSDFVFKNFPLTYSGGYDISWYTGYEDSDTFAIASAADLYGLAALSNGTAEGVDKAVNFANKTLYLASDITINEGNPLGSDKTEGTTDDWATTAPSYVWAPIGKTTSFAGVFDGQGNTISGIYLSATENNAGLFAQTTTTSTIQNISIKNSYISSTSKYVGSVVGYSDKTKLMNIYSDAYVVSASGDTNTGIGGIVGYVHNASADHNISNCWFDGSVTGYDSCGGIVGYYNTGTSNITDSLVTGAIKTTRDTQTASTGGIVGGVVNSAGAKLTIVSSMHVGELTESYSDSSKNANVGGIVGYKRAKATVTFTNVYTTYNKGLGYQPTSGDGLVTATDTENVNIDSSALNGHVAYNTIDVDGLFVSNTNPDGKWIIRETAEVLKDGVPIPEVFADEWIDVAWYYDNVENTNKTLTISTPEELYGFSDISQVVSFDGYTIQLGNDIAVNTGKASSWVAGTTTPGRHWTPIGKLTAFAGTFDGQGNTISGIYVSETTDKAGLFAQTTTTSTIQDISIKNSHISSTSKQVGSVVGYSDKTKLTNIYSDAYVVSASSETSAGIGGIVGYVYNASATQNISSCWFDGSVTGYDSCGGIVGYYNTGTSNITNSLVTGTVETTRNVASASTGGIVGGVGNSSGAKLTILSSIHVGDMIEGYSGSGNIGGAVGYKRAKATLTFTDVYTTQSRGLVQATSGDGLVTVTDTVNVSVDLSTLNGHVAYNTIDVDGLFVSNTNPEGEWVIRETAEKMKDGVPIPKVFADEWIDVAWYYENVAGDANLTISTPEELYGFADISQDEDFSGETVQLAADITANVGTACATAWTPAKEGGTSRTLTPIGKAEAFAGTFNGNGNTISGIYVNEQGNTNNDRFVGLFGRVTGTVQDFKLENSYIQSKASMVGSVVGFFFGNMNDVYSSAYVNSSNTETGGLVGRFGSTESNNVISQCWFAGTVTTSAKHSGGIVGRVNMGTKTIRDCLNSGTINSSCDKDANVGGIVGGVNDSAVLCTIRDCLSVGAIITDATTGIGSVIGNISKQTTIKDTYSTIITSETDWDTTETVAGIGNGAITSTTLTGVPREFDEKDIKGANAYFNTDLEFETTSSDGAWIAIEGSTPELAKFSEKTRIDDFGTEQRIAYGWYYNGFVHSEGARATSETYTIMDKDDLFGLAKVVNGEADVEADTFADDTVVLGASITVSDGQATDWKKGEDIPSNPWTPIGKTTAFGGTFDGHGNTISGIYVNEKTENAGLFATTGTTSTIRDMRIENSYIYSTSKYVGSVVGYSNKTKLTNIYSDAYVVSDSSDTNTGIGGIVGYVYNASTAQNISNCWFDGSATGYDSCGGIVGYYNTGTSNITDSLVTGAIKTTRDYQSASTGGIVGGVANSSGAKLTISSSIHVGDITEGYNGSGNIGGAVGYKRAKATLTFTDVYTTQSKGLVQATSGDGLVAVTDTVNVSIDVATFCGLGAYMLTDLDFVQNEDETIWAARRGQVPAPASLVADSDKLTIGDLGKADTSWLDDETNNGLSEDTPYIIDSVEELYGFAILSQTDNFEGKYIKLGADIDVNPDELATNWAGGEVATLPWYTIGVAEDGLRFAGVFDGDNHTISGIYLKQSKDYLGLFVAIEENAVVKNLRLENSYIEQTGSGATGSIIGDCRGTVDNVYSDAIIIASANYAGGIVACANGFSYKSDEANEEARTARTISNCWYDGTINMKKQFCGGIIGGIVQGEWTLTNCVFTGNINSLYKGEGAYAYAGGICGDIAAPAHEYGLDDTTVTSDTPSKLVVNSCISTGTIKTAVYDKGAGAIVGRMRTTDSQISILEMTNVFASREAGWSEVGSSASGATVEGAAVWTNSADRLVGFCTEKTVAGYYDGGSLNYSEEFVLREEGVPVPKTFEDMTNKVATIEVAELDELLCLSTMDTTWTTEAAVNNGLGHYVLRTTEVEYTDFTTYLGALKDNGFKAYIALPGDTSEGVVAHVDEDSANDGVYNVIYRRAAGEWIVNVLFVQKTNSVTLTISNGFDSLSPDLVPKATVEGPVSLSMLQLIGSGTDYYYGNSFVFKLPTGKFVIVDGGNNDDNTKDVADNGDFSGLVSYLKELQDDSTKPVEIQAWVVSHQHGDHFDVVREFVDNAEAIESLRVNALYINEPSREAMLCNPEEGDVMKTVRQQYRGIRMLQDIDGNPTKVYWCQTGQKYYFDGLTMDVIQSQEQIEVKNYGPYNALATITGKVDFNTASMNLLFTATNEKKVFITGDSNQVNMEYIKTAYGEDSKMLANINVYQVPHHGKNTSYKVNAEDNAFTDYLAGLVTENAITAGKFDVALFPCSLFYGIDNTDLTAFPVAGDANSHLIDEKSTSAYHYGNGTVVIELGDVVKKAE